MKIMQDSVASAATFHGKTPAGWRSADAIALGIFSVPLLIALLALAYRSTLFIPINYNEGWNAYHATALAAGGQLYYPAEALITNNYPPLSFLIVGALTRILGDALFVGRLVVWIGFLGAAVLVSAILRRLGNDAVAAAFGAMLFVAYSVVHFPVYVGVYDPQWLAHAVMLLGLWSYFRAPESPISSVAAGITMGLALFIKHNIVALPIAFAVWLFIYDRRASFRFAAAGLATGALGLVLCFAFFGPNFFTGLLAPRTYSLTEGYRSALSSLAPMEIPLLVSVLGAVLLGGRYAKLLLIYLCIALPIGIIQRTGSGVAINAFFEVLFAVSLGVGYLIGHAPTRAMRFWVIGACAAALIVDVGINADRSIFLIRPWIAQQEANAARMREQIGLIASHPGPAICETPALCYWAHKPFEVDPFNFIQGVHAGIKDDKALLQRVASGYYGVIQIIPDLGQGSLAGMLRDSLASYAPPTRFGERAVYIK